MISSELMPFFEERLGEVEVYLSFLTEVETAIQRGAPRLDGSAEVISATQQKILYASVYLQLYNLVEATVAQCLAAITTATENGGLWGPQDLNESLQKEWVRVVARTHTDMAPDNRLKAAVQMCQQLIDKLPVNGFGVEPGGGGNWDDDAIEKISLRVGCTLNISRGAREKAKRPLRDNLGALKLVKSYRNNLAHGSISFAECADGLVVDDLRQATDRVGAYLREVIKCFVQYLDDHDFLRPSSKPQGAMP
jgi:hypothetical protein